MSSCLCFTVYVAFSDKIQQVSECYPFFMFQFQERTVLSIHNMPHMLLSKNREKKVHFVKILLLRSILWRSWDICGNLHFLNYCMFYVLLHVVFCSFCASWNVCLRQRKGYCSGRTCSKRKTQGWSCLNVLGLICYYFFKLQILYSPYLDVFAIQYTLYTLNYLQLFPVNTAWQFYVSVVGADCVDDPQHATYALVQKGKFRKSSST